MDPLSDYPPKAFALDQHDHQHQHQHEHDQQHQGFAQYFAHHTWPLPLGTDMAAHTASGHGLPPDNDGKINSLAETIAASASTTTATLGIRTSTAASSMPALQTAGFAYAQAIDPSAALLNSELQFNLLSDQQAFASQQPQTLIDPLAYTGNFGVPLHASPTDDFIPVAGQEHLNNSLASSYLGLVSSAPLDSINPVMAQAFQFNDFNSLLAEGFANPASDGMPIPIPIPHSHATFTTQSSPAENWLDARSFSSQSDNSWTMVEMPNTGRQSLDGFSDMSAGVSPQHLHVRADSNSSQNSDGPPLSARSVGSYEEIFPVSPEPESIPHGLPMHFHERDRTSPIAVPGPSTVHPSQVTSSSSSASSSPTSSNAGSPKSRRRVSPVGVTPKVIAKKKPVGALLSKDKPEKKVGRRRGPLRPEQRQQAHEIRKLRACLRCKFLKKVCDKGDPCGGCQPSHARLWQVPCTRIDIKDIGFFIKDFTADYERHVTLAFSIANIKGFSQQERMLYVTHGYGFCLPIWAREVYVHDDSCFGVDWIENTGSNENPQQFDIDTAKLSAGLEGISSSMISEYLDCHLDQGFEKFVDQYFEGTPFLSQLLKTIHRYYVRCKLPVIRKGLKLVIAYALTMHITLITGLTDEELAVGKIDDPGSRYFGQTCAPVMINFQVKKAMADTWRELMKDILEELSALYSSVYSGEKLKNWPTIFMLAALILSVWELMQFDCHYRVPDEGYVAKFNSEMESVPVGVIVGLFSAISTKLPSFLEWDTQKHAHVLNGNPAVCDAMTEVRKNVEQHEAYLKKRPESKFDRDDFDSLSNKFLCKLVIRAN